MPDAPEEEVIWWFEWCIRCGGLGRGALGSLPRTRCSAEEGVWRVGAGLSGAASCVRGLLGAKRG